MKNTNLKTVLCTLIVTLLAIPFSAQNVCNSSGNLVIFTNYDGGVLNIDVDQNIPNLIIGVVGYEATSINLSGTFVGNVTAVHYAGYNGTNNPCNGVLNTSINGAPGTAATSTVFAPAATISNPNGYGMIICGYSCSNNSNQGGCNTVDQIEAYFLNLFPNSSLHSHRVQYNCWTGTHSISSGGSCCPAFPFLQGSIAGSQTVCGNNPITPLTSSVAATGGTGVISYQWESSTVSQSAGFTPIANATLAAYSPTPVNVTTYFRRGASTPMNSLAYSYVVVVTVIPTPTLNVSQSGTYCTPVVINLNANALGAVSYNWSGPNGFSSSLASIILYAPSPASSGIYTCTATFPNNCTVVGFVNITLLMTPVVAATGATVCFGQSATLTATGDGFSYLWTGPQSYTAVSTTAVIPNTNIQAMGIYTVTAFAFNTCTASATAILAVLPLPVISSTITPTICAGQNAFLSVNGANSYTLFPGGSLLTATNTISPNATTSYTIEGTSANGCKSQTTTSIQVNICVGIENESKENSFISVYPNPNNGSFTIKADRDTRLELVNSMGQLIKVIAVKERSEHRQDTLSLAEGIYYLVDKETKVSTKIVVTK